MTDTGLVYGREAIEKHYADLLQKFRFSDHIGKADQYSPHTIGTAGNEMWATGEWSLLFEARAAVHTIQGLLVSDLCT